MPSNYTENHECPICHTLIKFTVTNGIYPMRSPESGNCPICQYEVIKKNITGDIDVEILSIEKTIEPFLSNYKKQKGL